MTKLPCWYVCWLIICMLAMWQTLNICSCDHILLSGVGADALLQAQYTEVVKCLGKKYTSANVQLCSSIQPGTTMLWPPHFYAPCPYAESLKGLSLSFPFSDCFHLRNIFVFIHATYYFKSSERESKPQTPGRQAHLLGSSCLQKQ